MFVVERGIFRYEVPHSAALGIAEVTTKWGRLIQSRVQRLSNQVRTLGYNCFGWAGLASKESAA